MPRARTLWFAVALVASLLVLCLLPIAMARARTASRADGQGGGAGAPAFGAEAFTKTWGAGDAEVAGYDLTFPSDATISGQGTTAPAPRRGTAVTIFCTETFSNELRVSADPGRHPAKDEFPVMKLNLIEGFPAGVGDYRLMTSAFVTLKGVNGRPAGSPTKVSFGAQEWRGQVYEQLLFDADSLRDTRHSYFDGEADVNTRLDYPEKSVDEDALMLWARGLAWPALKPGEARELPILRSLTYVRMTHKPIAWVRAKLARGGAARSVTVPAGTFDADVYTCQVEGDSPTTWTFHVEAAEPHRILQWHRDDGYDGKLMASDRIPYRQMNDDTYERALAHILRVPPSERAP